MEKIKHFLMISSSSGFSSDSSYGFGDGEGSGYGSGDGDGEGEGFGSGPSFGSGSGFGSSYGSGDGEGSGFGASYGCGCSDLKKYNDDIIYYIDNVSTVIKNVKNNLAKGYVINGDLTTTPCFIAKIENCFGHGETPHAAVAEAQEKAFTKLIIDERIKAFWKCHNKNDKYPMRDFYDWHHKLTGSCKFGRDQFVKDHCLDLDNDYLTVSEFVTLCENDYGGDIIKRLQNDIIKKE